VLGGNIPAQPVPSGRAKRVTPGEAGRLRAQPVRPPVASAASGGGQGGQGNCPAAGSYRFTHVQLRRTLPFWETPEKNHGHGFRCLHCCRVHVLRIRRSSNSFFDWGDLMDPAGFEEDKDDKEVIDLIIGIVGSVGLVALAIISVM